MRILIHAPHPNSPTGYGQAVRNIAPRLRDIGHAVAIFGFNGLPGRQSRWDGINVYSRSTYWYGQDALAANAERHRADVVLSIFDAWAAKASFWQSIETPKVFWTPVQCAPLHADYKAVMETAADVWVYSRFGQQVALDAGIDAQYMPLGYDPAVFRPMDKQAARQWFGEVLGDELGGRQVIVMVAANASTIPHSRKGFYQALKAYKLLRERSDPANMPVLYIHTNPEPDAGGMDISAMIDALGLTGEIAVPSILTRVEGIPDEYMARIYAAADVLLAPSLAEGFGLPILEAQMCGTPVITIDHGSMPELVGYGHAVQPATYEWADGPPGGELAIADPWHLARELQHVATLKPIADRMAVLQSMTWDSIAGEVAARLGEVVDG